MMTKEELKTAGLFSCNGLADELGVDRRSIKKHLIDEEADHVQKGIKYYELNRVADLIDDAGSKGNEKQKLECKKLVAQINNIELRNAELGRKLIPSDEVARVWHQHVGKARSVLLGLEEIAPTLCGLDAGAIKEKLKQSTHEVIVALNKCPVDEPEAE